MINGDTYDRDRSRRAMVRRRSVCGPARQNRRATRKKIPNEAILQLHWNQKKIRPVGGSSAAVRLSARIGVRSAAQAKACGSASFFGWAPKQGPGSHSMVCRVTSGSWAKRTRSGCIGRSLMVRFRFVGRIVNRARSASDGWARGSVRTPRSRLGLGLAG